MLKKLRRSMTLTGVSITGVILLGVSVLSLWVSESQLSQRGEALFFSNVNAVAFRLRTDPVVDWNYLTQTESEGRLALHIEDNGVPLLFAGVWEPGSPREELIREVQRAGREEQGVDAHIRPQSALRSNQAVFQVTMPDGQPYRAALVVMRTENGYKSLTVAGDMAEERAGIRRQRWIFGGISFFSLVFLLGFSWWFAGRAIRPVGESRQRQSEFVAAASHELRTPLAVIRTSAAALRGRDEEERRFIQAIERECERTGRLVDDLLMLANADARTWSMEEAPVEMEQVLAEAVENFRPLAAAKEVVLALSLPQPLPLIAGDESRLSQLLSILLDNACRYTPQGGRIGVSAFRGGKFLRIAVSDSGPGIPSEHREQVFERFFRADPSRGGKEHYGLGLSIAREIASLHRGRIALEETPGGGLTVLVDLPLLRGNF